MKDSLKDFVARNRADFDDREPGDGWPVIADSLPQMKQRRLWDSVMLWRVAAVVLMGLCVYLFVNPRKTGFQKPETAHLERDFSDLELFYHNQIAEKVGLINDFDAGETEQFTQDFQKLDAMYQVLSDEMKNHPSQKVKDALVLNLLVRIDLLNQQLKKMEDSRKKPKTKPSEV